MTVSQVIVAGRYRLVRSLGNGGMGRVWLARDEVLRRDVAVKEVVLPIGLTDTELEELRQRTLREARAAARLSHPNVVQIYDVVRTEDQPWIVMEYVPSRSLHRVIDEDGPLGPERAARIGLSVLAALHAAHQAGVLHRDVKPSNVLISETGRVVLTDFGLATFDGGENAVTRPGLVLGSPQYIAPERARDGDSTPESDLWSLGATLYAAVEGRSPFARSSTMATLTALATERPDPMRRAGPLKPVLLGLLRKNVRSRLDIAETERLLRRVAGNETRRGRLLPSPRRPREEPPTDRLGGAEQTGPARARTEAKAPPAVAPLATSADTPVPGVVDASATTRVVPQAPDEPPEPMQPWLVEPRRRSRRGWWIAAAVCAAVLATLAIALPLSRYGRQPGLTGPGRQETPPVAAGPTATHPAPEVTGPTELDGTALMSGWLWYRDPSGFRIAVPQYWTITRDDSHAYFEETGGDRMLSAGLWQPGDPDVVTALAKEEADTAKVPGYQRLGIQPVTCAFVACAEWEYTYTGAGGTPIRTIIRGIRTASGRSYEIMWRTRINDWQINQSNYLLILASFHT